MYDANGILHKRNEAIAQIAEDYFVSMFTSSNVMQGNEIISHVQCKVTPEMNRLLLQQVTNEEIKSTMFMIGSERAPGPDGFTASFYHQFWDTIETDVCCMV